MRISMLFSSWCFRFSLNVKQNFFQQYFAWIFCLLTEYLSHSMMNVWINDSVKENRNYIFPEWILRFYNSLNTSNMKWFSLKMHFKNINKVNNDTYSCLFPGRSSKVQSFNVSRRQCHPSRSSCSGWWTGELIKQMLCSDYLMLSEFTSSTHDCDWFG